MKNPPSRKRFAMKLNAPQARSWFSNTWIAICTIALIVSYSSYTNAQAGSGKQNQPADPLTDPLTQTQTRSQPTQQQQKTQQPKKQIKRPINPNAKPKVEIPKPEELFLDTKDGVRLKCTYFPPPKSEGGKARVVLPFILLHDWDGDRNQMLGYASFLQNSGHAAIVPDLRGHGDSTEVIGLKKPIDYKKFRKSDVMSAQKDIERCKKFLVQQHNKQEVNVDLLCVVAVGQTSVLAVEWTLNDWFAFPARNVQGIKQGQDVKALMLVSPTKKMAGISMMNNLKHPMIAGNAGPGIPLMVMWSSTDETAKESEAIANFLEDARPDTSAIEDKSERIEATTFFSVPVTKYKYTGLQMIEKPRVERFWPYISNLLFEQKVVANAKNFPWESREPKKEEEDQ